MKSKMNFGRKNMRVCLTTSIQLQRRTYRRINVHVRPNGLYGPRDNNRTT